MRTIKTTILLSMISGGIILGGCGQGSGMEDTLAFPDVRYVKEFPVEINVVHEKEVDFSDDGVCAFTVCDSLMLCSLRNAPNLIKVMSWPEMNPLGELLHRGNGPFESVMNVLFFEENVEKANGDVRLYYDDMKGSIVMINVSQSLAQGEIVGNTLVKGTGNSVYSFCGSETDGFVVDMIGDDWKSIDRRLYIGDQQKETELFKAMNEVRVKTSDLDFNMLGRHSAFRSSDKRAVDAFSKLNLINIYSLDGNIHKSVCVGSRVDNIRDIESMPYSDRPTSAYNFVKGYDNFFAAIYYHITNKDLVDNSPANSEVQLFSWDGEPLCRIRTDKTFSTMHIDPEQGVLIGMDVNGVMYYYNIDLSFLLSK